MIVTKKIIKNYQDIKEKVKDICKWKKKKQQKWITSLNGHKQGHWPLIKKNNECAYISWVIEEKLKNLKESNFCL